MTSRVVRVAVLGSGNIGIDLCERLLLDPDFEVVGLVGRRTNSPGLKRFEGRIEHLIPDGMQGLCRASLELDGVFDATSAFDHAEHWDLIRARGMWAIDLTPSRIGQPMVPTLVDRVPAMQLDGNPFSANYSMVTCGGQSSAPLLYAISEGAIGIKQVEISSSIAARSAGPATRRNIDQYISSTEHLAEMITRCSLVKAILVLNPAEPPVMMRTTVTVRASDFDLNRIQSVLEEIVATVQLSVPGYSIVVAPHRNGADRIVITARVTGAGYFLPEYSGNLDIINAAAVETARIHDARAKAMQIGGSS